VKHGEVKCGGGVCHRICMKLQWEMRALDISGAVAANNEKNAAVQMALRCSQEDQRVQRRSNCIDDEA
jgi:hypothetical protein